MTDHHMEFDRTSIDGVNDALSRIQAKTIEAMKMRAFSRTLAMNHMSHYLHRLDMDISSLNVVHVAGSKGKGSTSAFIENILHNHGYKTGLYTSPHLISLIERFRINTESVDEQIFIRNFWEVWDRLVATQDMNIDANGDEYPKMPAYFAFLTLVAFRIYLEQKVDVLVLEVGMGGKLDATNIVPSPLVTAITTLSLEHTEILGNTIDKIAREKCGIFKPYADIVTFPQHPSAWDVLLKQAAKVGQIPILIDQKAYPHLRLGIEGEYQSGNANVALLVSAIAMHKLQQKGIPIRNRFIQEELQQDTTTVSAQDEYKFLRNRLITKLFSQMPSGNGEQQNVIEDMQSSVAIAGEAKLDVPVLSSDSSNDSSLDGHPLPQTRSWKAISPPTTPASKMRLLSNLSFYHHHHQTTTAADVRASSSVSSSLCVTVSPAEWVSQIMDDIHKYYDWVKPHFDARIQALQQGHHDPHTLAEQPTVDLLHDKLLSLSHAPVLANSSVTLTPSLFNFPSIHPDTITPLLATSLATTRFRGRCDTIQCQSNAELLFHIDGAHTIESVTATARWFQRVCQEPPVSVVIDQKQKQWKHQLQLWQDGGAILVDKCNCPIEDRQQCQHAAKVRDISPSNDGSYVDQTRDITTATTTRTAVPAQLDAVQKMMIFNCGHVRSPFNLMQPLVDQIYTEPPQDKMIRTSHPNMTMDHVERAKMATSLKESSLAEHGADRLSFFTHVFFCPFDHERLHTMQIPTLVDIFDHHAQQLGVSFDSQQTTAPLRDRFASHKIRVTSSLSEDEISENERNLSDFSWQLSSMVVWDHVVQHHLTSNHHQKTEGSPADNTLRFHKPEISFLRSVTKTQQGYHQVGYDHDDIRPDFIDDGVFTGVHSPRHAISSHHINPIAAASHVKHNQQQQRFLVFHPPLATLQRSINRQVVQYHVMNSSHDAVMAAKHIAQSTSNPQSQSRVLVTGSLYLAGDAMKHLGARI